MNSARHHHRPTRLLAVASAGGHFLQLCRIMPAFAGCDVTIVSTAQSFRAEAARAAEAAGLKHFHWATIPDANRKKPLLLLHSVLSAGFLLLRHRPDVIVTTGAAPGLMLMALGKKLGARTIWIDSIANAEGMSLSGRLARKHADLWLSQWPDVAVAEGAEFAGAVL